MALFVHKYGGTSVGSLDRINAVADRIVHTVQQGHQVVVVVSAMSGETNRLINMAKHLDTTPSRRELDVLISTGEQVSASLLSIALISRGYSAISLLSDQVMISTDANFGSARIQNIETAAILEHVEHGRIVIVAGFQGRDPENNITTLGRGGTDTTAVAIAAAINAEECQIFTDVDGVFTTDPRIEPNAKLIPKIPFEDMLELASLGAKVLQKRSVELAGKYQVKVRVLSSFLPNNVNLNEYGSLITYGDKNLERLAITGIATSNNEAMICIKGINVLSNNFVDILELLALENIEIDMLVQSASSKKGEKVDFTFTLVSEQLEAANGLIKQYIEKDKNISLETTQGCDSLAKISVVGIGVRSHVGVISKVLKTLALLKIPVLLISTSEIKMSVLIDKRYMELGVTALHSAFDLHL